MNTLGVSFGYHDASASLVIDGKLVCASAEERFTRQKHDAHFPKFAIEYCLKESGLELKDLDQVVFHEDPYAKFTRILTSALSGFPNTHQEFINASRSWLSRQLWALQTISLRLRVPSKKIRFLSHHFSHATHAFMGSGFENAGILIVDAVGDWSCTALYSGEWKDGKPSIKRVLEIPFPNSLGLVYSAVTAHIGFSPNDSECTTMALAAFGRPKYVEEFRKIIPQKTDGSYSVDTSYFHFVDFYKGAVTQKFIDLFGPARDSRTELPFSCFSKGQQPSPDDQRFADLAHSIQFVIEERLEGLTRRLKREVNSENLCLGGGVAMNCVATSKLVSKNIFSKVYMPPDPGDGGTSIGTALYVNSLEGKASYDTQGYLPGLGGTYDESEILEIVEKGNPNDWLPFRSRGSEGKPVKWKWKKFSSTEAANKTIATFLTEKKIVGLFRGRHEFGPRALGHRSILIRPDDIQTAIRLSRQVKHRALYRPYAISLTEKGADKILAVQTKEFYRWMQHSAEVKTEMREKVQAALHVDNSTRPQIVFQNENPEYHGLISEFELQTGIPAVLNTSFNASGYPLVRTPVDALAIFARTDMDVLVINNFVVWKEFQ